MVDNKVTSADIQQAFADSKRLDKVNVLRDMLAHFKQKHDNINSALYYTGEEKRCSPFKTIDVDKINLYIDNILFNNKDK